MEMLSSAIVPYAAVSAAIAAVVMGIRNAFPYLKGNKMLSSLLPLVLGALAGYLIPELAPEKASTDLRVVYGVLAGSFSAPIYHVFRRAVQARLKGNSQNPKAGAETTFDDNVSKASLDVIKTGGNDGK